jgi:predicted RNase H-like nuclease
MSTCFGPASVHVLALGVDVARGGWIAVALEDGAFVDAVLERRFPALVDRFADAVAIGVDVPIGLPHAGTRRRADLEARTLVGARRSSIFFTPSRAAVEATSYGAAREVEPSTSAQGWALRTAILDVNRVRDPRVHEVHPEVSFAVLAGKPLAFAKRTWNGHRERLRLLRRAGIRIPERLDAGLAAADDVLDAAVAAWTATRIARREHVTVPANPARGEPVIHV